MLKERLMKIIAAENANGNQPVQLFQEEKEYAEKHNLFSNEVKTLVRPANERFQDAYIERGDKGSGEFLGEEQGGFLQQPISYFKTNLNEFMYMESPWFEVVDVDAVSFEVDDVFQTYIVMLGLKKSKKFGAALREFFTTNLKSDKAKFELLFDGNEGIWNSNFALNEVDGFEEGMTIEQAYRLIYRLLFHLCETIEHSVPTIHD